MCDLFIVEHAKRALFFSSTRYSYYRREESSTGHLFRLLDSKLPQLDSDNALGNSESVQRNIRVSLRDPTAGCLLTGFS